MTAEDTFRSLFNSEYIYVRRSLIRLGVREKDVDDQTQEVFLRVYARLGDVDERGPTRSWLFSFALRVASNYRQLRRHTRELSGNEIVAQTLVSNGESPEDLATKNELRAKVLDALEPLNLDRRAVFVMYELDQMPASEIAEALALPVNTVYSRLRRARQEFKSSFLRLNRPPEKRRSP